MKTDSTLLIIGNGISGTTLARHVRKGSSRPIVLVSDESPYFFSRTALMYVYMGHMKWEHTQPYEKSFWDKNNITLVSGRVIRLDADRKTVTLASGQELSYGDLVWALGSIPNTFGWPGEDAGRVQGLYHKQDLEQLEAWTPGIEKAVIVGGGLIGIELVEMLHSRGKQITFLVRESSFWNTILPAAESECINQQIRDHGIDLRLATELQSIETDAQGTAQAVITHTQERIPCQYVGLTAGVRPHIDFLRESALDCGRGIRVNRYLETNLPHVYALGDCAEQTNPLPGRQAIEAVWYTGRMMGETLAQTLLGRRTAYQPGPWFNSAKFFDIEYQTYGQVSAQPYENEQHWLWQHPSKPLMLRWAYNPKDQKLIGMNALGIRLRHEVIHHWLLEGISLKESVKSFSRAHFDPEFTTNYQAAIAAAFQSFLTIH